MDIESGNGRWWTGLLARMLLLALVTRATMFGLMWYSLRVWPPSWSEMGIVLGGWAQWDTGWYVFNAIEGYDRDAGAPAFFPLFPLLIRAGLEATGSPLAWEPAAQIAILISNVCFLVAVPLFAHLVRTHWGERVAQTASILLCLSPLSFFFSAGYTESLFLLLVVLTFLAGDSRRWWLAALCVALAGATRSVGILLLPALLLMMWRARVPLRDYAMALAIAPLGLLAFSGYLWWQVGDPLAFLTAQNNWGGRDFRIQFFYERIFERPRTLVYGGPDYHDLYMPIVLLGVVLWVIGLASLYGVMRWVGGGIAVFTTALVLSQGMISWVSLGRYLLPAVGVYIVVALWIERSRYRETALVGIVSVSVMLLSLLMVMFGHALWVV